MKGYEMEQKAEQQFGGKVMDFSARKNGGTIYLIQRNEKEWMTTVGFSGDAGIWFVWSHYGMTEVQARRDFKIRPR